MISRQLRVFYYAIMRLPMLLNGRLYKVLRAPTRGVVRVQLGPGQKNYRPDRSAFAQCSDCAQHGVGEHAPQILIIEGYKPGL
jgi:hypothetical protein